MKLISQKMKEMLDLGKELWLCQCCYTLFILRKHKYETKDPNNPDPELDSEVSSQELSQGSESSRAPSVGTVNSENEVFVDCRVCKEPIVLDCVQEYIACTEPNGNVHFAAHFVCLGFYPKGSSQRKSVRATYRCPRHGET